MSNTFVCLDCETNCRCDVPEHPSRCLFDGGAVEWLPESEDEQRAREETNALKYLDLPESKKRS